MLVSPFLVTVLRLEEREGLALGNALFCWLQQPKTMASTCFQTNLIILWSGMSQAGLEPESWWERGRSRRRASMGLGVGTFLGTLVLRVHTGRENPGDSNRHAKAQLGET
jgi:hypothetical protein